ncbi:MAG TPA: roadblock/LC7 domain-containing protein, partial [Gemmatirosa sp.]
MSSFRDQLRALQAHPGVRAVVAAGRDGLLIDHAAGDVSGDAADRPATADPSAYAEHLAALAPGLMM